MNLPAIALGAGVGAILGVFGTILLWKPDPAIQAAESPSAAGAAENPAITALEAENKRLAEQLAETKAELARAARRAVETPEAADAAAEADEAGGTPEPLTASIHYPGLDGALAEIDWATAGKAAAAMTPMMRDIAEALANGEELPMDLFAKLARHNADLIAMVGPLMEAGVPGTGPNGVFTHPVVSANLLDATLRSAGMTMTDQQRDAMQQLAARYAGELEAATASLGEDASQLDRVLAETELKNKFYEDARLALTPEQVEQIQGGGDQPGLDLFSTGLVWAQFQRPLPVRDAGDFADDVVSRVRGQIDLGAERSQRAAQIIDEWAQGLDLDGLPDLSNIPGPLRAASRTDIRAAALRQQLLMQRLSTELGLTPEERSRLSGIGVIVPIRGS
jgi:hypothetical protein